MNDRYWMLRAMELYGGGFAGALAVAWQHADSINSQKLYDAFPELVEEYTEMGKTLKKHDEKKEVEND